MTSQLSALCKWRTAPRSLLLLSFSPRVLRSPTDSLALVRLLLVLLFQYLPSRVTAPIRDGRYCGWRRSGAPLLGSVPSRCRCFTLHCAPLRGFVVLRCLLRYWLGFYLKWQHLTTVSPLYIFTQLQLVYTIICSWPILTKFTRLSILVADIQLLVLFRICSIFQPMEQMVPSPSDGWHACSRRCQLALDLTVRGTGFPHPPMHSPGDCNVVGVVLVF